MRDYSTNEAYKNKTQSDYTLRLGSGCQDYFLTRMTRMGFDERRLVQISGLLPRLRVALFIAGLFDVVLHQLRRVGLRAAHDQISRRPEVA